MSKDGTPNPEDAASTAVTSGHKPSGRRRGLASGLILLSAAGLWGTGRMTWVTADIFDDKAGDSTHNVVGAVLDPAATPIALALLAALVLSLAMKPIVRRILGAVMVVLAGITSFRAVNLLTNDVDLARIQSLLSSGAATQKQNRPDQISEWAQVTSAHVHAFPVALALLAAALGVIGGVVLAMNPGGESKGSSRYETPEARRATAEQDLEENPESGRVMWDALDAGVDPTEDPGKS